MGIENGAVAVARLQALPEDERRLIRCLRLWSDGRSDEIAADLAETLGVARAAVWTERLQDLVLLMARTARRPLLSHALDCDCVGSDEAVFAHFVGLAARGDREDAMLVAVLLVRADAAPLVVSLAETVGRPLLRGRRSTPVVVH